MARRLLTLAVTLLLGGCATLSPPAPVETRGNPSPATTAPAGESGTGTAKPKPQAPGAASAAATSGSASAGSARDSETTVRPARPAPANDPATLALLGESDRSAAAGRMEEAVVLVERALRLRPQDAVLWLRLAELHLARAEPAEAERLARRGIALAGNTPSVARYGWLLVADARTALGDTAEADRIRAQWQPWRG